MGPEIHIAQFTWLCLLLVVPMVYLLLAATDVQSAAYGVRRGARSDHRITHTSARCPSPEVAMFPRTVRADATNCDARGS